MRWPWVSRCAYELLELQLQSRDAQLVDARSDHEKLEARLIAREAVYDRLVQQVVGLKRKGFEPSTAGKVTAAPDSDAKALHRAEEQFQHKLQTQRAEAEREFEESAVSDLMEQGLTRDQAIAEARRLRSSVTDMHPAGG